MNILVLKTIGKESLFIAPLGRYRFCKSECILKWKFPHQTENPAGSPSLFKLYRETRETESSPRTAAVKFYTLNVLPIVRTKPVSRLDGFAWWFLDRNAFCFLIKEKPTSKKLYLYTCWKRFEIGPTPISLIAAPQKYPGKRIYTKQLLTFISLTKHSL